MLSVDFLQKGHYLFDTIIGNTYNLSNKERLNNIVKMIYKCLKYMKL